MSGWCGLLFTIQGLTPTRVLTLHRASLSIPRFKNLSAAGNVAPHEKKYPPPRPLFSRRKLPATIHLRLTVPFGSEPDPGRGGPDPGNQRIHFGLRTDSGAPETPVVPAADGTRVGVPTPPRDGWLSPVELQAEVSVERRTVPPPRPERRASNQGFLPLALEQYLALLDWTGRQARRDKRGQMPAELSPILERLQLSGETWVETVLNFGRWFHRAVGRADSLSASAKSALRWAATRPGSAPRPSRRILPSSSRRTCSKCFRSCEACRSRLH